MSCVREWSGRPGALRLLLAALLLLAAGNAVAGVNLKQGKWKDGRLTWYFNANQMPASLKADEFVALTTRAFGIWSAGCKLSVEYGGPTSVAAENADAIAANKVIVGFAHMPSGVGGDAAPFSTDAANNSYYFTAGVVQISADNTPYNLASDRLLYILVHEIGHLLNLAHSDEPYSVMYANPYVAIQSATEPYKSYADDMSTCANLYGGKGIQPVTDYGAVRFSPTNSFGLSAGVGNTSFNADYLLRTTGSPQDTWQPASQNVVDLVALENAPWFKVGWDHATTSSATVSIIAPSGDIVLDNYSVGWGTVIANGYFPFREYIWLNGAWKMRVYVNGQPAAETLFTTINGVSSPAKLELAAIAETSGTGNMALRLAKYSPLGIASSAAYLNGDYAKAIQSFKPAAGKNTVELWAESTLPRYRAGASCGQPGSSADLTRQLAMSADAQGRLVGDSIDVSETGTLIAYSAKANIQSGASGTINVYVAGQVNDALLFRQADGSWGTERAALFSFTAPGAANFDILRDFDTRGLPSGTSLLVGYGSSLNELIERAQYKIVRVF